MTALVERLAAAWSGAAPLHALEVAAALALGLLAGCTLLLVAVWRRSRNDLGVQISGLQRNQESADRVLREELARSRSELAEHTRHLREEVSGSVRGVGEGVEKRLDEVRTTIDRRLLSLQQENEKKLEQMRAVVDEKLQGTLEKRLGEAFQQVSHRLEAVHKGLGEMQNLAVGVGDLKKVLSNVKTRGTFGETTLESLLDQTLAPTQWERQVQVKRGSAERVDFAVRLPGAEADETQPVWLPIDAKFPQEDHARLIAAQEQGDPVAAEAAAKALEQVIRTEARRIRDKYIAPPTTTEFAVLFLPTESLYAEVLRRPGLAEWLQVDCRVTVAGPMTVLALLNSLKMGFRTLAIQKRSAEVTRILGSVKAEFGKFGDLLDKVQKQLDAATNTITSASTRSRTIERKLDRVQQLPETQTRPALPPPEDD